MKRHNFRISLLMAFMLLATGVAVEAQLGKNIIQRAKKSSGNKDYHGHRSYCKQESRQRI